MELSSLYRTITITVPDGATHISEFYGTVTYWRKREVPYFNNVMDGWQTRHEWRYWENEAWHNPGPSFSPRKCVPITVSVMV